MLLHQTVCSVDVVQLYKLLFESWILVNSSDCLFCDVQSCQCGELNLQEKEPETETKSEERESLKRERGEDWEKTGSLNECVEKRPGIGTDTPHHTTVETLTSLLSLFSPLPSLFLSLPLSFPPSALPLHLASSLSLTPFPLFYSLFSLLSSFLFLLCSHHLTLLLFLSPLFANE